MNAIDGLTIRDLFAAHALQGITANPSWNQLALEAAGCPEGASFIVAARMAYSYAEAMCDERNRLHEATEPG